MKSRKKPNDDYLKSEYNSSDKEIYRKIDLIMVDILDSGKSIRFLIEYGNDNTSIFHGYKK